MQSPTVESLHLMSRIPRTRAVPYRGRADFLALDHLRELWFHLTNRCNMTCAHCLFSSSPADVLELPAATVLRAARDAHAAGCRLFVLTGGEPLVHIDIDAIVSALLNMDQSHVVMLTNGRNLASFLDRNNFDMNRFHVQISLDGLGQNHDVLRGRGAFTCLCSTLEDLRGRKTPFTLSMCVTTDNVADMADVVDFAADAGAGNVHFMWYFVRGRGSRSRFAPVETIFDNLMRAADRSVARGVTIDNLEALKTQVFAPAGTLHDGSSAGWESLAMGPDNRIYPSAALVGVPELATDTEGGLIQAWRESPVLERIRRATVANLSSPLRFILGGGDMDHSYLHGGTFLGDDPYARLHELLALWLIAREAGRHPWPQGPGLRLRMGEVTERCHAHGRVALLHSNCLLATAQNRTLTIVKEFYSQAVGDTKTEILNPVCYPESHVAHIPEKFRFRGYGCGSPVLDAGIREGDRVVDLGCGAGVECFIAAKLTGPAGQVTGIDMLDAMLQRARQARPQVAANLGYDNLDFRTGYLEDLPMDDGSADLVTSNCVMNLSVNKRRSFSEILRILRPGGRLVMSDVVCEEEPDPAIRNDETLHGQCIAGALTIPHLTALLEEIGFDGVTLVKRFPYREVAGHPFFSLTLAAHKPQASRDVSVIYRGPLPFLVSGGNLILPKGIPTLLPECEAHLLGDQVFVLDEQGNAVNVQAESTCACFQPVPAAGPQQEDSPSAPSGKMPSGCMLCGSALVYSREVHGRTCVFCGRDFQASSVCENGHYVCDHCHGADAVDAIRQVCLHSGETDMVRLFEQIRKHPAIPVHGPEYHAMVPAIILAVSRNLGADVSQDMIETAISRARGVAGGFCGFMGVCGAAVGVGIAFSLLLDANPIKAAERKQVQDVTQSVLAEIARFKAARCCQREGWIALTTAAVLSREFLPVVLKAEHNLVCQQYARNAECLGRGCPLYPRDQSLRPI